MTVELTGDLADRVEQAAAARGVTPAQLVMEAVTARLPAVPPSFIGIGASGTTEPIGARHRELLAERLAGRTAADM